MKNKDILRDVSNEEASVPVKSHWYVSFFALLICLLLAVVVWVCVMNATDTDYIPLELNCEARSCVLSADAVQVEGRVCDLKGLNVILVDVTQLAPGTYALTEQYLDLPEGVHLSGNTYVTLTVTE